MKSRCVSVLAVLGLSAGLVGAVAPPASAAGCTSTAGMVRLSGVGVACWQPDGDHWYLDDTNANGRGFRLVFATSYGRRDTCYAGHGAANGWKDCNFNVKEHETIRAYIEDKDGSPWSGWGSWVSTS